MLQITKAYMIIGIDTYHDSSEKGKSACGFVASMNQNTTRYFSGVSFQTAKVELCNGLEVFMTGKFWMVNILVANRILDVLIVVLFPTSTKVLICCLPKGESICFWNIKKKPA